MDFCQLLFAGFGEIIKQIAEESVHRFVFSLVTSLSTAKTKHCSSDQGILMLLNKSAPKTREFAKKCFSAWSKRQILG